MLPNTLSEADPNPEHTTDSEGGSNERTNERTNASDQPVEQSCNSPKRARAYAADDLQLARARKHSPGFAEYLEARAKLEADAPIAPRTEPTGLDALETRRPELAEARAKLAALNPGLNNDADMAGTETG